MWFTPLAKPLTAIEAEGRDVYVANGCSYCHTQQAPAGANFFANAGYEPD